jgi:uncharacterized protein YbbC (DUF1343 family)
LARPGISVLLDERRDLLHGKRIGVLSHASGVLPDLRSSVDALVEVADVRAIFSPEHGLSGAAGEGEHVDNSAHRSGIPIHSLYGAHLSPSAEQMAELDVIVCDLQDVGCRFYTYVWTVMKLIEAAAKHDVAVVVTDRPNPIGGATEGPGVEHGYRTLVGLHDVPIRHGLTIGELAQLVNAEASYNCDLMVVPCDGWRRSMHWMETGLPWVPPSPNMPTPDVSLLYPGTCLLEGVNVSVGRGTAKPFEWLGAPWIDGAALAGALNALDLPGVRWRPAAFVPFAQPYAGQLCEGVQPHVTDARAVEPLHVGVALLLALRQMYPEHFSISAAGSIYADEMQMARRMYPARSAWNVAHFDRLAGSPRLRQLIEADAPLAEIVSPWQAYQQHFLDRARPFLLYA